jgi:hypothetical protein
MKILSKKKLMKRAGLYGELLLSTTHNCWPFHSVLFIVNSYYPCNKVEPAIRRYVTSAHWVHASQISVRNPRHSKRPLFIYCRLRLQNKLTSTQLFGSKKLEYIKYYQKQPVLISYIAMECILKSSWTHLWRSDPTCNTCQIDWTNRSKNFFWTSWEVHEVTGMTWFFLSLKHKSKITKNTTQLWENVWLIRIFHSKRDYKNDISM